MYRLALLLSLVATISSPSSVMAEDINPVIQQKILDATLKIKVLKIENGEDLSAGSGTVIYNGDWIGELGPVRRIVIATAAHVVKPVERGYFVNGDLVKRNISTLSFVNYIRDNSGQIRGSKTFPLMNNLEILQSKTILAEEVDAAFVVIDLRATSRWLIDVKPVEMAGTLQASSLKIGSDLLIAGCPLVMNPVIFRNRLIQRNMLDLNFRSFDFLGHLVSRVLTPGNSGGGVYNSAGQFIGVVTLRIGDDFGAFTGIEHILPRVVGERDVLTLLNP